MGGVALASLGELSFSPVAFGGAMVSNVASASRAIIGKEVTNIFFFRTSFFFFT
jgi:hypothetical protein